MLAISIVCIWMDGIGKLAWRVTYRLMKTNRDTRFHKIGNFLRSVGAQASELGIRRRLSLSLSSSSSLSLSLSSLSLPREFPHLFATADNVNAVSLGDSAIYDFAINGVNSVRCAWCRVGHRTDAICRTVVFEVSREAH